MMRRTHRSSEYHSGLEDAVAGQFKERGLDPRYESTKLAFIQPLKKRTYKPDFQLPSGVYVETKGMLTLDDRQKHVWIKEQHPDIEIRFVFTRSKAPIRKGSPTTYGDWCEANGFRYADKLIPSAWFNE